MAVLVISDRELNRIFVANDRILAVRGIDGAYLLNKDENQGEIFIKPSAIYQARAFSIFVTTEQGHNYNLILVPVNIPARTIELKPLTGSKQAERWERDGDYMEIIASLMTAMVNAKTPDGYALIVPHKEQVAVFDELKIVVTLVYSGKYLRGEVLSVTNESKHAVYLDERQFYHPNVRALALIEHNLEPKSKTLLYRVVSDE
jgi:conjugal transfer pilus assembly protein TraK